MSSCFYNANGTMLGGDVHDYYTVVMVGPVPVPKSIPTPHFTVAGFDEGCDDDTTRLPTVTSDGQPMIQGDFKIVHVLPHLPITVAPPHPAVEPPTLITIIALSGSVALLAVSTVTGVGKPLACCVHSTVGTNLNCGDPIDLPLDIVINENTVLTQPTAADFARAGLDVAVSGLISKIVGAAFKKIIGKTLEKMLKEALIPLQKKAEDYVKSLLEELAKLAKDPIKNPTKAKATLRSLGVTHV